LLRGDGCGGVPGPVWTLPSGVSFIVPIDRPWSGADTPPDEDASPPSGGIVHRSPYRLPGGCDHRGGRP